MGTHEMYYEHNYKKEWNTNILDIIPLEKGYGIILEESAFYPGGGGQPCDLGTINEKKVIDIYKKDGRILHVVEEILEDTNKAVCYIDQERRLEFMQQHSGQHLLSAIFYRYLNGQTSSFHLGLDYTTIDISISHISNEEIEFVENKVNEYIYDNIPIKHYFIHREEIDRLDLRKKPQVEQDISVIEIQGVDAVPCCGTHLALTGQLGILKIIKTEHYKGNTRIYFKCGKRALEDYQYKDDIVSSLVSALSTKEEELLERVEKELEKSKDLSRENNEYKKKIAYWEAKNLIEYNVNNKIIGFFKEKNFETIDNISREIMRQGNYIVLFASSKDKKVLLEHSGEYSIHCGNIFREYLGQYQGKGGGNNKKAQAAFFAISDLEKFYRVLQEKIQTIKQ